MDGHYSSGIGIYPDLNLYYHHEQPIEIDQNIETELQNNFLPLNLNIQQAYQNIFNDVDLIQRLPALNWDDRSIQSLKQIEEDAKNGILPKILSSLVKVLQVVSQSALKFAVGIALSLIIFSLLGVSYPLTVVSMVISVPCLIGLLSSSIIGKVAVRVLNALNQHMIERRLSAKMQDHTFHVQGLKKWRQLNQKTDIKNRLLSFQNMALQAQQQVGFQIYQNNIQYVQYLLDKMNEFENVEQLLDTAHTMPLFDRQLNR